jgi:hypothetical protein
MTEEDTLLLMLVALFSNDRQNSFIVDRNKIAAARDHFLGIMERSGLDGSRDRRHTSKVLLLLPLLRTLNTSFMEVLKKVQVRKKFSLMSKKQGDKQEFLFLSSKSRQVSLDRLFRVVFRTEQDTKTGNRSYDRFFADQGFAWAPCPV